MSPSIRQIENWVIAACMVLLAAMLIAIVFAVSAFGI